MRRRAASLGARLRTGDVPLPLVAPLVGLTAGSLVLLGSRRSRQDEEGEEELILLSEMTVADRLRARWRGRRAANPTEPPEVASRRAQRSSSGGGISSGAPVGSAYWRGARGPGLVFDEAAEGGEAAAARPPTSRSRSRSPNPNRSPSRSRSRSSSRRR
eukprot:COSAG04_NODE_6131_length_1402_cov_1.411358_1_plen_159_part_00